MSRKKLNQVVATEADFSEWISSATFVCVKARASWSTLSSVKLVHLRAAGKAG